MTSPSSTTKLTYKQLQATLKELREQGLTSIKLNSKQEVLQAAYDLIYNKPEAVLHEVLIGQCTELTCDITSTSPHLITSAYTPVPVQAKLNDAVESSCYPFCSNTVKVKNNTPQVSNNAITTLVLPAMDSSRAPSWLCKPHKVYVIDGIDYLPYELDQQLTGAVCELPQAANERKILANQPPRLQTAARKDRVSNARPVTAPIINTAKDKPQAKLTYSQEPASPYFIDTHHNRFTQQLGSTELQAARNLEDAISATRRGLGAVIDIAKGFPCQTGATCLKGSVMRC